VVVVRVTAVAARIDLGDHRRTTVPEHDAADRQGLRRVTLDRSSSGRCHMCARTFETLSGAVSHGRSAGHVVEGVYSAAYLYLPGDGAES